MNFLSFITPWCSQIKEILKRVGITHIDRIEKTTRLLNSDFPKLDLLTETLFCKEDYKKQGLYHIDKNIDFSEEYIPSSDFKRYSDEHGLGFDEDDIEYYKSIFDNKASKSELYDLAQSNSEHSRHWVFKGKMYKENGHMVSHTLFDMIRYTLTTVEKNGNNNSVIAFSDNSSSILGYITEDLLYDYEHIRELDNNYMEYMNKEIDYHITLTAETHNFPTGVSPFNGASTGVGGRIRDNQAIGRGGSIIAGSAGYSVGNLHLDNQISNDKNFIYSLANCYYRPINILIEASNGASDYGNKIGEPIIHGFTRSFGMRTGDNIRREWLKPIMFTSGIGKMNSEYIKKYDPKEGYLVVKVGGNTIV